MISYKNVRSNDKPQDIEVTDTQVFLAKNIEEYSEVVEDHEVSGYKYDYIATGHYATRVGYATGIAKNAPSWVSPDFCNP